MLVQLFFRQSAMPSADRKKQQQRVIQKYRKAHTVIERIFQSNVLFRHKPHTKSAHRYRAHILVKCPLQAQISQRNVYRAHSLVCIVVNTIWRQKYELLKKKTQKRLERQENVSFSLGQSDFRMVCSLYAQTTYIIHTKKCLKQEKLSFSLGQNDICMLNIICPNDIHYPLKKVSKTRKRKLLFLQAKTTFACLTHCRPKRQLQTNTRQAWNSKHAK